MIRILLFVIGIIAAALAFGWLADRPGAITVEWLGYEIKTSAFVGALALAALVAALILAWTLLRYLLTRPAAMSAYMQERRRRQGFDALTRGLLAIGVGDRSPGAALCERGAAQSAERAADRASEGPSRAAQGRPRLGAAHLPGHARPARDGASRLARPVPRSQARQRQRRGPRARRAGRAHRSAAQAGASTRCSTCRPAPAIGKGALATLAVARKHGNVEADVALRRRAVLLTAEARDLESSQPDKALALATEALRLAPSLIPAAEIAGRLLASKGESEAGEPPRRPHLEACAASGPRHRLCLRQAWRVAARAAEARRVSCEPHAWRHRGADRHRRCRHRGARLAGGGSGAVALSARPAAGARLRSDGADRGRRRQQGTRARMARPRRARSARPRLDRRRLHLRPLASGLSGHRRGRCLRMEGAGRRHRPRRRDIADRGKPRAARAPRRRRR